MTAIISGLFSFFGSILGSFFANRAAKKRQFFEAYFELAEFLLTPKPVNLHGCGIFAFQRVVTIAKMVPNWCPTLQNFFGLFFGTHRRLKPCFRGGWYLTITGYLLAAGTGLCAPFLAA